MSKIKVLFLGFNPTSTPHLRLDEEQREIDAKIRRAGYRDQVELIPHLAVRLDDLSELLMRHEPNVVHLSGHGLPGGSLVLHEGDRAARDLNQKGTKNDPAAGTTTPGQVPAHGLGLLLGMFKKHLRVAVLNACYSEAAAKAIAQSIDCAVGTSRPIRDDHAISFAAEFYQALVNGKPVKEAFDFGVIRLINEGYNQADDLLGLETRTGVDASNVVLVGAQGSPGRPAMERAAPVPDRPALVLVLSQLSPADFATLASMIDGAETRISQYGSIPEKVAELLRWATSPTGPGLARVAEVYEQVKGP